MACRTRGLCALFLWTLVQSARAQEPQTPTPPKADEQQLARELEDMRFRLDTLEEELAQERARRSSAPQSASVFNPGITVFGNILARVDDQPVFLDDDPTQPRIDDRTHLREVELDFRAAIDPWADGVVIATFDSDVPGEFSAGIEEGYVVLKKLPLLDAAPGGLKLKIGRFRPEFGRFNYIHQHDLPQPTYPRALSTFLGSEGFVQDGVSGQFFLPSGSENSTLEATVQMLDGGGLPLAATVPGSQVATLGHLKWFRDLTDSTNMELGVSGYESDSDHQLLGLDGSWKWKPLAGGEWGSLLIGGELFASRLDDPALGNDPTGHYLWSQYQVAKNLYLGLRYDHAEVLTDASQATDTTGAYLTAYTTEFLRFRIGLEHSSSDVPELDGLNTAELELNFVYGSHPVEPYWVNR